MLGNFQIILMPPLIADGNNSNLAVKLLREGTLFSLIMALGLLLS